MGERSCQYSKEELEKREGFVKRLGEFLSSFKPNIIGCKLFLSEQTETVKVYCANGHIYEVDVDGDSEAGIVEDVISRILYK